MRKYIIKYSVILISLIVLEVIIKFVMVIQLPLVLINLGIEFNKANYLTNTILIYFPYLKNIVIALLILFDLSKLKIKGIPVVLLSILSYFAGILFFLFLINSKISHNDK